MNLEQGHAILAGHSFEYEIAVAVADNVLVPFWQPTAAQDMFVGATLESISERVFRDNINPGPVSGRQEILENYVNRLVSQHNFWNSAKGNPKTLFSSYI